MSNQVIEIPTQQPVDITKVVVENPYSPVAWAVSVSLVIGAVGGVIRIMKSSPQEWESMGKSASMVIRAFAGLLKVAKSKDKHTNS
ncbi:MAG TPA: hypothetical protein VK203_15800 [Nostocaceae cyanobacterium]|nr:hypothetical protein [Nostocaceae cyanobacterium]